MYGVKSIERERVSKEQFCFINQSNRARANECELCLERNVEESERKDTLPIE